MDKLTKADALNSALPKTLQSTRHGFRQFLLGKPHKVSDKAIDKMIDILTKSHEVNINFLNSRRQKNK